MATFRLEIRCDGAAFDEEAEPGLRADELREILRGVRIALDKGATSQLLHDSNGNTCGEWSISEDGK